MIHSSSVFPRRLRVSNVAIRRRYLSRRVIDVPVQVDSAEKPESKIFSLYRKSLTKDFFRRLESKTECPENLKRMHYFSSKTSLRPEARDADLKFS